MTKTSKSCKFLGRSTWLRRTLLCLAPDNICRMSRKASRSLKICPKPRSFDVVGTSPIALVLFVVNPVSAAEQADESCTTWVTWLLGGHALFTSFARSIVARAVGNTSTRTCPTTRYPRPTTRIASCPWPCDSSWKTACPIKPPAGTCGAITAFSSPFATIQNWVEAGGKKGGPANVDDLSRLGPG